MNNDVVKAMLYEYGVNAGTDKAVKILQEIVGVHPDGDIGSITNAAINAMDLSTLVDKYTIAKIEMYTSLANSNSRKYDIYLRGWLNRALKAHKWLNEIKS